MTVDVLEDLAQALLPRLQQAQGRQFGLKRYGEKHTASGTPIDSGYSHGPGGNFSFPGVDPEVFHTVVGNIGIIGQLPATPSVFTDPTFSIITGVQDTTGAEKTTVCADAPTAGLIKNCILTAPFGRYERATPELELNRLGQQNDRADPMDLRMVGSPIHQGGPFSQGAQSPDTPVDLLSNEISRKFWELNVAFHRLLSVQLWQGDPANNNGQAYKEITGFQQLVNTGYVDAPTNASCPSADSDLKNFNYLPIDANGEALVDALSYLIRTRKNLAFRTGVQPVRWVLAMREELFWEITAIWSCSYLVYRCNVTAADGERVMVNAQDAVRFRDEMRAGNYLLLDGERIEVVLDDGIPEATTTTNANVTEGCFSSDIYFIPMSVVGGRAVTYLEYFNYDNPSLSKALRDELILGRIMGPFLVWPRQTNQCIVWQAKVEPRLVMRTPWLAGRLQNVMYCPTQHTRQPFPDDPYFVDGGITERVGPSLYALWKD
jgi:hypothetical protein